MIFAIPGLAIDSSAKLCMMSGQSSSPVMHDACDDKLLTGHHTEFRLPTDRPTDRPTDVALAERQRVQIGNLVCVRIVYRDVFMRRVDYVWE
eukprot:COSAG05_NODE_4701_length_1405_cov_1.551302_2_plen_92_part_00